MKGVILAGGKGTRLYPMTQVTNKHLVSVGNLPLIEYPIHTLTKLRVNGISIVTGGDYFSAISQYLMETHPQLNFSYHPQAKAAGIAQALSLVEQSVGKNRMAVVLGDNVFSDDFYSAAREFEDSELGAMLFLKEIGNPERFGVAEVKDGLIVRIEEKPKRPQSNLAVTGLYFYDDTVFDKIRTLHPSDRGEYEITDVNNLYLREGKLGYRIVGGFWSDAGMVQSREVCDNFVKGGLEKEILKLLIKNAEVKRKLEGSFGEI